MKKIIFAFAFATVFWSCKTGSSATNTSKQQVKVSINLIDIKDDKVFVTVNAPKITTETITYSVPKTVPGTYSVDNFGKFIENLKAYDTKGNSLEVSKKDDNTWTITNAQKLSTITYLVNDTFEAEKGRGFGDGDVFSPTGTNIEAGKNIMLNTHGFVGYFQNLKDLHYQVSISHPETLWGATSMTDLDASKTNDVFETSRYAELVENPIMYAKPDYTTFTVNGMEIQIAIYSPTGKFTAESITPEMKKMMTAQKNFLGNINSTKKYSVLLYLSSMKDGDAKGFGALEHPTATTVVLPESMPKEALVESMKDVVSHEFFHIVTPLTIHSKEIQYFDYNDPKMSQHLWMYEGVTEYFANLFQINQGLITEDEFYKRITAKIEHANSMNDTMPFTIMSANVLKTPYKEQYTNVYEKGALIGMCLDIIIREKSNGERGILDLMQKLSKEYGVTKPFNDEDLFAKITTLTYPEVGAFLSKYVAGPTPIPYADYIGKVGISIAFEKEPSNVFIKDGKPYITYSKTTKEFSVIPNIELNDFFTSLNIVGGDVLLEINNTPYTLENIEEQVRLSENWKENDEIIIKIKKAGKEQLIKGKVKLPYSDKMMLKVADDNKKTLKEAWLKK